MPEPAFVFAALRFLCPMLATPLDWIVGLPAALLAFFLAYPAAMNALASGRRVRWAAPAGEALDLACVITAYRSLDVARPLAESLLHQDHPRFRVYLVADDCPQARTDWYDLLHDPRFTLLRPDAPLGGKVASLIHARERFLRPHDAVVVFDPDNLATPDFLSKLDGALRAGFDAVQGRRAAKNLDTPYAAADAAGELYKNYIEREAPTRLGASATVAGSGMAVRTEAFDAWLASPRIAGPLASGTVIPAEDKILQHFFFASGRRIPFRWDAVLYDEKVEAGEQVTRQRTRWTWSWVENVPYALGLVGRGLGRADRNALLMGLYGLVPPLFLLALGSALAFAVALWLSPGWALVLAAAGLVFAANILLSLRWAGAPPAVWKRLYGLPLFAARQVLSLAGLGKARKDFLVTEKRKAMRLEDVEREE